MIKKQFLKSRPVCKATFMVPAEQVNGSVGIVGEFNNWNADEPIKMTKKKDGNYSATVELPLGREVEFRYVTSEGEWLNDAHADRYVTTPYGTENSVVSTQN